MKVKYVPNERLAPKWERRRAWSRVATVADLNERQLRPRHGLRLRDGPSRPDVQREQKSHLSINLVDLRYIGADECFGPAATANLASGNTMALAPTGFAESFYGTRRLNVAVALAFGHHRRVGHRSRGQHRLQYNEKTKRADNGMSKAGAMIPSSSLGAIANSRQGDRDERGCGPVQVSSTKGRISDSQRDHRDRFCSYVEDI